MGSVLLTEAAGVHPYYPLDAKIIDWAANEYLVVQLLFIFAGICAVMLSLAGFAARSIRPDISRAELITVMWFALSGSIHLFFEGYFVYNHSSLAKSQTIFGQLWKEYALADSRYLSSDPFLLCMETITAALWGPLCFIVAYQIVSGSSLRHPLQLVVSMGQVYGDVLYYSTSMTHYYQNGISYWRPEPYYFWGYYFFMNAIWIVVPAVLAYKSIVMSSRALRVVDVAERNAQMMGAKEQLKKTR